MQKVTFIIACFALLLALTNSPVVPTASGQLPGTAISTGSGTPTNCGASDTYAPGSIYIQSTNGHVWTCSGVTWTDNSAAGAGVPSGLTAMVVSGACPSGYTEVTALNGAMPYGTLNANGNIGTTGGADSVTPTVASLTAAAQTFTGSSATTSAVSAGTPAGTNGTITFTPVGTVTPDTFGTTKFTTSGSGTAAFTSVTGGHVFTGTAGTVPAETFTGSAMATHTHTLTATGTNSTSAVTGTLNSLDNRSAFVRVIFCTKT